MDSMAAKQDFYGGETGHSVELMPRPSRPFDITRFLVWKTGMAKR